MLSLNKRLKTIEVGINQIIQGVVNIECGVRSQPARKIPIESEIDFRAVCHFGEGDSDKTRTRPFERQDDTVRGIKFDHFIGEFGRFVHKLARDGVGATFLQGWFVIAQGVG
ncbi:MAG: hypothetical protein CUN57_03010, partial [Phototrophicales bacterium]